MEPPCLLLVAKVPTGRFRLPGRRDVLNGVQPVLTLDTLKLQNCAECEREMLGESFAHTPEFLLPKEFRGSPRCGGRIYGRPICTGCLETLGNED
jgi:hypothetical protein